MSGLEGVGLGTVIGAGGYHACAIVDGGVSCWGDNSFGDLGNNSTLPSDVPVAVQGLGGSAQALAVGADHACALVNGGVQCWGDNGNGELGNNSTTASSVPVAVVGLEGPDSGVQALAAGQLHTCALVNGGVLCWGGNVGASSGTAPWSTAGSRCRSRAWAPASRPSPPAPLTPAQS